jgi:hypothetical protein
MWSVKPLLWSSGQSSWLQIQRARFDSQTYQIFREVMVLEGGPLNLVSTTKELHRRKSSGSGLESREYVRRDQSRWPCGTLYPQQLALTSPTSGGNSVDIVRSRTQTTEFFYMWRVRRLHQKVMVLQIVSIYSLMGNYQLFGEEFCFELQENFLRIIDSYWLN